MAGTVSTPIFQQDGQYLTFIVETAQTVTLGQVVKLVTTGTPSTVQTAGAGEYNIVGVAVSANRVSRTATDDTVSAGARVTVMTRGVVNCVVAAAGSTMGKVQIAGAAGTVTDSTDVTAVTFGGATGLGLIVGKALATGTSGNYIPVLLTLV